MADPPPLDPDRHALFLDFDGTLVGFADDPASVALDPAVALCLRDLASRLDGALGIVSGRRIADLDRFLDPLPFAAAGVHGLERRRRPDGAVEHLVGPDVLDPVRRRLAPALAKAPRLTLEDKGTALVLHYRTAPDLEAFAKAAMREAVADAPDLLVMEGEAIVEVHPAGMDKGRAVADFMAEPPFAARVPVYLGDDTTDEFALRWVREAGGVSVKVGAAPSVAEFRLENVAAVHRWLAARD
ncbi:trehalose 6-phosphate phosphatase [Aureimonas endophytica]|uniref:Trehalose 6-phosphate phosphatase n=1 Tax=Aureimonas endophytica TaxID=2027858 RepID=A0A917A5X3_9HYPH|nr:trehalose-phosphatase [Aureimonas endophytica]GGE25133.1 trehalose 6-phosphate phosphatase [Aureimonas endophytica]